MRKFEGVEMKTMLIVKPNSASLQNNEASTTNQAQLRKHNAQAIERADLALPKPFHK